MPYDPSLNWMSLFNQPQGQIPMQSAQNPAMPQPMTQPMAQQPAVNPATILGAIFGHQQRTDAGWSTNNQTSNADWGRMFNNTGVNGGQMKSSVDTSNPGYNIPHQNAMAQNAQQRNAYGGQAAPLNGTDFEPRTAQSMNAGMPGLNAFMGPASQGSSGIYNNGQLVQGSTQFNTGQGQLNSLPSPVQQPPLQYAPQGMLGMATMSQPQQRKPPGMLSLF